MSERLRLFPPVEPFDAGMLEVGDGHSIYFEQSGNLSGKPVIVCHGGPGGGTTSSMRRYFDPNRYRIVLFDQRGCGKSTPNASLDHNTTWDLVADMEELRRHLGIEKWQVFGGSWGSTLSLVYAQTHPDMVSELVLRGIFMLRKSELHWFYQEGASWLYPDLWEKFLEPIAPSDRGNLIYAYHKILTGNDRAAQLAAARAWSIWEGSTVSFAPSQERVESFASENFALAFARIECHYFFHNGFFDHDDQILRDAHKIAHIPTTIVQGRYDVVTPMRSAWDLYKVMPDAELDIINDAGHAASEPGIIDALVRATNRYAG